MTRSEHLRLYSPASICYDANCPSGGSQAKTAEAVHCAGARYAMDEIDHRILETLQDDFPLSERPYESLAERLGICCDELWRRTERLLALGLIRRIVAILDSLKLGYRSTLAAISGEAGQGGQAGGGPCSGS